jgi:hypothetical protein
VAVCPLPWNPYEIPTYNVQINKEKQRKQEPTRAWTFGFLFVLHIKKKRLMAFYRILEPLKWVLIMDRSMCDNDLSKSRDKNLVSAEKSFIDQAPSWSHLINTQFNQTYHCMYFIVVKDKNNIKVLNFNIFKSFWYINIKNKYILK